MTLEIIPVYENLDEYAKLLGSGAQNPDVLWQTHAIAPYWPRLSRFAPMDISDRQPQPITDLAGLKRRVSALRNLKLPSLLEEFERAVSVLPDDDEQMTVALYPLDSAVVREKQGGVWGVCTWGNLIICIDPLAPGYEHWIPYVFAHEYHHNVWGALWYNTRRCELGGEFVSAMLSDGLADSFALSLYPDLRPGWLFGLSDETCGHLWREHYHGIALKSDVNYEKYMFGDAAAGIPWCAGYAIGYRIVQAYRARYPETTMAALLEMRPVDIFLKSEYGENT